MGAEHLVSDTASAREYLNQELARITLDELLPWYSEPCGIEGNYTRVSLRTVKEGLISAEDLLSAFIASANSEERPSVYSWAKVWHEMIAAIDRMEPELPMYEQDKLFIEQVLAQGQYAISHSPDYRNAYSPHYRIVRSDIFKRDIEPLLPHPCHCPAL